MRRDRTAFWLVLILILSLALRVFGIEWDRNTHLHPDERFWSDVANYVGPPEEWNWSEVIDPEQSTFNPRYYDRFPNYVYGTLPLWASEATASVLGSRAAWPLVVGLDRVGVDLARDPVGGHEHPQRVKFNTGYEVTMVGRLVSALIDTATVGAVFFLGRELAGRKVGLLAALLQSLVVLHIQYSHFLGSEPWVAFFVTLVTLGAVRLARGRGGWRTRLATGLALGLAVASKLSGVAAVAAPLAAATVTVLPELVRYWQANRHGRLAKAFGLVDSWIVMALVAAVGYRVAQPFDFEGGGSFPWLSLRFNERFFADIEYLQDVNGGGNYPWVQPLVGATPLWHPVKQMLLWGMGPGLGIAAVAGVIYAVRRVLAGQHYWAVPLGVVAAYLVLVATQFYAIVRYLQPAYPALVAMAAAALVAIWSWARGIAVGRRTVARLASAFVIVCVGATVFWALAFVNGVYGRDNPRLAASDWVNANLEPGSVLSVQEWDDPVPWGASSFSLHTLRPFNFAGDTPESVRELIASLDQVDYVVETSHKFYGSLPRTPARFPQVTEYYRTLFDGSLGFDLVRSFESRPSLFGITIDDSGAEEAFTVYDHPPVHVWRKSERFSVERAEELLNPDRARVAVNAIPKDAYANASMLRPGDYEAQQANGSFSAVHSAGPNSVVSLLAWFVLIQAVSWAVAPAVLGWAGRSAGAVYGFTKMAALLVLAVPTWLVVSWGWFEISAPLVWAVLVAVLVGGAAVLVSRADTVRETWARHRRVILAAEAVFVGIFLAVVALRAANPDLWHPWRGGEKPMELAYFTAITGSTTLPPYDPWLAGGSLNYYYFGWFLVAVPTRILGVDPSIAFNLSVATFAALAGVAVFSTVALLADLADRRGRSSMAGLAQDRSRLPIVRTGLLGTAMFLVLGNLDGLRQIFRRWRQGVPLGPFDWWDPSRVVEDSPGHEVTEFPAFTVLFGDLHPHFMAMGLFGLTLAVAIGYVERRRSATGDGVVGWLLAGGLGLLTAVVRMTHTWDLPVMLMATGTAIGLGVLVSGGPLLWRVGTGLGHGVWAGFVHLIISAPYRNSNVVADSGFHRSTSVTPLDDWLIHWGLFLFVAAVYLVFRLVQIRPGPAPFGPGEWGDEPVLGPIVAGFVGFSVIVAAGTFALQLGGAVAAIAAAATGLAGWLVVAELKRPVRSIGHLMVAMLWLAGFAVMLGVELFTLNADIGRLNTVFKFWLQIWHLFSVAAAFGVAWVLAGIRRPNPESIRVLGPAADAVTQALEPVSQVTDPVSQAPATMSEATMSEATMSEASMSRAGGGPLRAAFGVGLVALMLAGALYPALAVKPRVGDRIDPSRGPSLQGHLWLEPGVTNFSIRDSNGVDHQIDPGHDRPLIDWLRANVSGRPTIVEAVGGAEYQWWGRISITTGLPTVLGWRWHQEQQRTLYGYKVNERKADVVAFYQAGSLPEVSQFLAAYDVAYVIVGSIESTIMSAQSRAVFDQHGDLRPVFRSGDQVIYEVTGR